MKRRIRLVCAVRGIELRDFYHDAFRAHVAQRVMNGLGFEYLEAPQDVRQCTLYVSSSELVQIRQWADFDGMTYSDAYYTAISRHLDTEGEEWIEELVAP